MFPKLFSSTQKHMPKMVYTQLKNVAKKTILRVLSKHAESDNADKVGHVFTESRGPFLTSPHGKL
jgi:hypothetical protein